MLCLQSLLHIQNGIRRIICGTIRGNDGRHVCKLVEFRIKFAITTPGENIDEAFSSSFNDVCINFTYRLRLLIEMYAEADLLEANTIGEFYQ